MMTFAANGNIDILTYDDDDLLIEEEKGVSYETVTKEWDHIVATLEKIHPDLCFGVTGNKDDGYGVTVNVFIEPYYTKIPEKINGVPVDIEMTTIGEMQ